MGGGEEDVGVCVSVCFASFIMSRAIIVIHCMLWNICMDTYEFFAVGGWLEVAHTFMCTHAHNSFNFHITSIKLHDFVN